MNKFSRYVDFKMNNPYAENHPDFELDETPITVVDWNNSKLNSYQPS